jgi:hypothetical protein
MNWTPSSENTDPTTDTFRNTPYTFQTEAFASYKEDIKKMADMGVNTARLYYHLGTTSQSDEVRDEFYKHGIWLIEPTTYPYFNAGITIAWSLVTETINHSKDHSTRLLWGAGNEWDVSGRQIFTQNLNGMAQYINSIDPNHPTISFISDTEIPGIYEQPTGNLTLSELIESIPNIDIWAVNGQSRGASLGNIFSQWESISDKPMIIGSYGTDSYDHSITNQNETIQSTFNLGLWNEIASNSVANSTNSIASGGLLSNWNDEWWISNVGTQDISSVTNNAHPDGYYDEEHTGIVDIDRNPKQAYYDLQQAFKPTLTNGFEITHFDSSNTLTFESERGVVYRVEYADNLMSNDWQTALGGIIAETNTTSWTDDGGFTDTPPSSADSRFYRIKATDRVFFVGD